MTGHEDKRIEQLLARLGDGLTRLSTLVSASGKSDTWRISGPDGWSAHDVLVHMRASSEILSPRITQMLVRDVPPLIAFDERAWGEVNRYADMSADELFARIAVPRYELIQLLRRIPDEAWQRSG